MHLSSKIYKPYPIRRAFNLLPALQIVCLQGFILILLRLACMKYCIIFFNFFIGWVNNIIYYICRTTSYDSQKLPYEKLGLCFFWNLLSVYQCSLHVTDALQPTNWCPNLNNLSPYRVSFPLSSIKYPAWGQQPGPSGSTYTQEFDLYTLELVVMLFLCLGLPGSCIEVKHIYNFQFWLQLWKQELQSG